MIIIGFDPGKKGGIARIDTKDIGATKAIAMPMAGNELDGDIIAAAVYGCDLVIIEVAASRPDQGVVSMFSFGKGYGLLQGVCHGLQKPFELVRPQVWKGDILAGTARDKQSAIDFCRDHFPGVSLLRNSRCRVPSDGIADALCIAEYGRRNFSTKHQR